MNTRFKKGDPNNPGRRRRKKPAEPLDIPAILRDKLKAVVKVRRADGKEVKREKVDFIFDNLVTQWMGNPAKTLPRYLPLIEAAMKSDPDAGNSSSSDGRDYAAEFRAKIEAIAGRAAEHREIELAEVKAAAVADYKASLESRR